MSWSGTTELAGTLRGLSLRFLAVVCLIHCCAYGDVVLPSKTPNVEYILKGRSERVELYAKTSNTNEYLICMDLIANMGRDCFRCSIFINTDCVYVVKQNTYIADMRNEPELTTLQNDRPCGVDVVCEKKVLSPLLLHELKNFLSLKMAPKYERMAWGSGIGHVVVTFQKKGEERVAIYDRPVWRADLDRRKIDFCRDVYGKERADSYASFLRVYRRLMLLLNHVEDNEKI